MTFFPQERLILIIKKLHHQSGKLEQNCYDWAIPENIHNIKSGVQASWYSFPFLSCVGQISLPPGGDTFVVLPGENVSIAWKLNVSITDVLGRWWTFLPKNDYLFADIIRDEDVIEMPQYSPGPFTITKPSTLILKNVTILYNGTYTFSILPKGINLLLHLMLLCLLQASVVCILSYTFLPCFCRIFSTLIFRQ